MTKPRRRRLPEPLIEEEPLVAEEEEAAETAQDEEGLTKYGEAAELIQADFATMRVRVTQMPYQRACSEGQKKEALKTLGAQTDSVSMSKILFWKGEPAVKRVRSCVSQINHLVTNREYTLPHPEPGYRLIKKETIPVFDTKFQEKTEELLQAARALKAELPAIILREQARQDKLFSAKDYDFDPATTFGAEVSYPTVGAPDYLTRLSPETARRYEARIQEILQREADAQMATIRQAAAMAEQQAVESVVELMDGLLERLEGVDDKGKRKVFRDDTANKVFDDLEYVRGNLNRYGLATSGPLDEALQRLQRLVRGQDRESLPQSLRTSDGFREEFHERGTEIVSQLIAQAVPERRRAVLRSRLTSEALKGGGA